MFKVQPADEIDELLWYFLFEEKPAIKACEYFVGNWNKTLIKYISEREHNDRA